MTRSIYLVTGLFVRYPCGLPGDGKITPSEVRLLPPSTRPGAAVVYLSTWTIAGIGPIAGRVVMLIVLAEPAVPNVPTTMLVLARFAINVLSFNVSAPAMDNCAFAAEISSVVAVLLEMDELLL